MNDVETIYTQYEDIVSEFTEQVGSIPKFV